VDLPGVTKRSMAVAAALAKRLTGQLRDAMW